MNYSTLTTEQRAALDSLKSCHCKTANLNSITDAEFETAVMTGIINGEAKRLFDAAVQRLATAAASMPYDARMSIVAQVESQVAAP